MVAVLLVVHRMKLNDDFIKAHTYKYYILKSEKLILSLSLFLHVYFVLYHPEGLTDENLVIAETNPTCTVKNAHFSIFVFQFQASDPEAHFLQVWFYDIWL